MRTSSIAPQPWDKFAASYTEKVFSPLQFVAIRKRIVDAVKPGRVLDMGCGPTPLLLCDLLELPDVEVSASDLSTKMLEAAKRNFSSGAIRFVYGDNRHLPFPDDYFDTVISVNSILPEQRDDIELMFAQVFRVLRPGGRFVAVLPAFETSVMARDDWRMDIGIDEAKHREYDTTGWQCFYTHEDITELMQRHRFGSFDIVRLYFDSEPAIEEIRRIYGYGITAETLRKYPLFEHLLIAEKPAQTSSW